ncbi:MAG: amidohydrolase family protein [Planctomycetes bacterium]|nr:amidohydrolase family protein [Planctomycetota bacterium]
MTTKLLPCLLGCLTLAPQLFARQDVLTIRASKAWISPERPADNVAIEITRGKVASVRDGQKIDDKRENTLRSFPGGVITAGFVDAHRAPLQSDGVGERAESFTPELSALFAYDPWSARWKTLRQRGVTSAIVAGGNENVGAGQSAFVKSASVASATDSDAYVKFSLAAEAIQRDRRPTSLLGALELVREGYTSLEGKPGSTLTPTQRVLVSTIGGARRVAIAARERREILGALELLSSWQLQGCLIGADDAAECIDELAQNRTPILLPPLGLDASRKAMDLPVLLESKRIPFAFTGESIDERAMSSLQTSLALAVREGVTPKTALASVTTTPASIAGRSDRVGSLQIGRDGDLIVWSGEPWDLRSRILLVVQDGKIVFEAKAIAAQSDAESTSTENDAR